MVALSWLHHKGRLLHLPANISLGWLRQTLAYYETDLITGVKLFIVEASGLDSKFCKFVFENLISFDEEKFYEITENLY
jgi:hypothetical protein